MTTLRRIILLSFLGGAVMLKLPVVHSFSNTKQHTQPSRVLNYMAPPSGTKSSVAEIEAESEQLRKEIEELRKEALSRLEALSEQLGVVESSTPASDIDIATPTITQTDDKDLLPAPMPITFTDTTTSYQSTNKMSKGIANILDESKWKISLSIGREPGTWMPKDWGKSGQRLNLSFTADFTPSQLFDREDFFRGGYSNAKILSADQITLGPSLSEGQRTFKVKNGGWQVTRGDGPMGTDLLRFFIELDEEITHTGADVYLPKGRIYMSCGYFPFMNDGKNGMKDAVKDEIKKIEGQIVQLQKKKDDIKNPFNLERIKLSRDIFKLKQDLDLLQQRLSFAMVRQPDKKLLRYSPTGDVGLTKEGKYY